MYNQTFENCMRHYKNYKNKWFLFKIEIYFYLLTYSIKVHFKNKIKKKSILKSLMTGRKYFQ